MPQDVVRNLFTSISKTILARDVVRVIPMFWDSTNVGEKDTGITRLISGGWSITRSQSEIDKRDVFAQIATASFADRVFGFANLYKSRLEIFVWLGFNGILGVANGTARIGILLRRLS